MTELLQADGKSVNSRTRCACMFIALFFVLTSGTSAQAEIYRWVDKDGNVHYSDQKPPDGVSEQERVAVNESYAPSDDVGDQRRRALLEEAAQRMAQQAPELQPPASGPKPQRAERCRAARRDYAVLTEEMPVYRTESGRYRPNWSSDYYQGKREYVADADREGVRDQVIDELYRHCDEPRNLDLLFDEYDRWIAEEFCQIAKLKLDRAERPDSRTPRDELARMRADVGRRCRP